MSDPYKQHDTNLEKQEGLKFILRYISFWPYILVFILFSILSAYIYLRYSTFLYKTSAVIEIIDKAQDSEMALPTAMTIFNRSMINLENEFGRLKSYNLHEETVKTINANVRYYTIGKIKNFEEHKSSFLPDYKIDMLINSDEVTDFLTLNLLFFSDNKMEISYFINGELENKEVFSSHSTKTKKHSLPIELHVNNLFFQSDDELISKKITITPIRNTVETYLSSLILEQNNTGRNSYGSGSDQIKLSMSHPNINVCEDYLFSLINNFDQDGIQERQMSYSRTINFATDRLSFLQKELEIIEKNKQEFKIENKLTDIQSDASLSINKQYDYNDELFKFESQSDLVSIIKDELKQGDYSLLPSNFGLDNESINILINQYNELVKERLRHILEQVIITQL